MANVLLGVTGSVAAVKTPELAAALAAGGHAVRIVATQASLYFFDPAPLREILTLDADEWPGTRYRRGDPVRHIELRNWADLFTIAPLDANTLAKLAGGFCDNALTCTARAWDTNKPLVLAPAMNTLMWQHPLTRRHLRAIASDWFRLNIAECESEEAIIEAINARGSPLKIAAPVCKTLACGDEGVGGMADVDEIARICRESLTG